MRARIAANKDTGSRIALRESRMTRSDIGRSVQTSHRLKILAIFFSLLAEAAALTLNDVWLFVSEAPQYLTSSKKFMQNYKIFFPIDVHLVDDKHLEPAKLRTSYCC